MNRTKTVVFVLLFGLCALASSGCTIAKISAAGPRPLYLNNPAGGKYSVIKHFVVEEMITFDYTNSAEMDRLVAEVISETKADAIINMRITVKYTPGDWFCNAVSCNLANARTWAVEGDAIKFK
jgi:hypothetical protein